MNIIEYEDIMTCSYNKKYEKLTRSDESDTKIQAGHVSFTVQQLEDEMKADSDIGRKLKSIEAELEKY